MRMVWTRWLGVMAAVVLAAAGCSRGVAWMDQKDLSLPLVQRAADRVAEGDIESAVRLYHKALEQEPNAARAHLDLAFLLQEHRKDYIGAIYHYRRYLELRPDAEKKDLVEERIRLAEQLFAADVLGPSRMSAKVAALERENETLKVRLQDLSSRIMSTRRTESRPAAAGTVAPPAKAEPVTTYRVKRGDTLSSIATDLYGDGNRWKDLQVANSDILGNSSQVRVGQVLVVP